MQDSDVPVQLAIMAAILVVFAAVIFFVKRGRRRNPRPADNLTGITGWLALLGLGVTLLPFKLAISFGSGFEGMDSLRQVPNGMMALWIESACIAALFVLSVVVAVAFWNKRVAFKRLFIVLWALLLAFALADPLFYLALFDAPLGVVFNQDAVRNIAGNIFAVVWVIYIRRSRRVANTFIR